LIWAAAHENIGHNGAMQLTVVLKTKTLQIMQMDFLSFIFFINYKRNE